MKSTKRPGYQRPRLVVKYSTEEERCRSIAVSLAEGLRNNKLREIDRLTLADWLDKLAVYEKLLLAIGRSKYANELGIRARAIAYHAVLRKRLGHIIYKDDVANYWEVETKTVIDALTNHKVEANALCRHWIFHGKQAGFTESEVLDGEEALTKKLKEQFDQEKESKKAQRGKGNAR